MPALPVRKLRNHSRRYSGKKYTLPNNKSCPSCLPKSSWNEPGRYVFGGFLHGHVYVNLIDQVSAAQA
jgi:hypothetical protein